MSNALFVLLLLLTALDLAFVHATDVVAGVQLLPLWALAIGSLWLRRMQQHTLYRRAWNAAVLAVFALLVHHATTTGLLHMLEDGLVLAVLCQVHLLNNVGDRQRPDLIFFNSFLVAFVTSFFAPDVTWSLLFVAHAFVLVPGLQLHAMLRRRSSLDAAVVRLVLRDSVPRTVAVCALAAAVFVVCPRDFRREGWLGETMLLRDSFEGGVVERIQIGDEPTARLGDEIVAHLLPASGQAHDVPSHWRTNVFSVFDGSAWSPQPASRFGTRIVADRGWRQLDDAWWRGATAGSGATVRVRLHDLTGRRLPLPLAAAHVALAPGTRARLDPNTSGGITLGRAAGATAPPLAYLVELAADPGAMPVTAPVHRHFLALPDRGLPAIVHTLASQLRAELPPHADSLAVARASGDWLEQHRRYQLPGDPGFARNLGEFLLGSGAGHCEYFATALALLLRLQDVPCRVAGGFLAHEWDADSGAMVLRSKHAHAWVEVLAADGSWHTFDATPAAEVAESAAAATSWWSGVRKDLERWWQAVTGFDRQTQAKWFESLRALPSEHPVALAAALAIAAAVVYVHRRRRQAEPTIVALERAMRAARLSLRCGETPRELLARAEVTNLEPRLLARLLTATRQHEASRYRTSAAPEGNMIVHRVPLLLLSVLALAAAVSAQAHERPAIVRLEPAHLATGVDPATTNRLVIAFDRDMDHTVHALCGGGPSFPTVSSPRWLDARTFVIDARFAADRVYAMDIACPGTSGFRAANGVPLPPQPWRLATRGEPLATGASAAAALRLFVAIRDHYSYRDRLGIDWDELARTRHDALLAAADGPALALAFAELLGAAQDPHISVRWQECLLPTYRRDVAGNFDVRGLRQAFAKLDRVGRIGLAARTHDGIGYLLVGSFAREQKDDFELALEALRALRSCKAIVLDVRTNGGGDESLAKRLAAFFVDGDKVYAAHRVRDPAAKDGFRNREERTVRGNREPDVFKGPVAVLMGPLNMSSCEAFLLMMKQASRATLIGADSYGSSGNPQPHTPLAGLTVMLPSWQAMRPDGTVFEGEGIAPHVHVATTTAALASGDPVLAEALQRLRSTK